MLTRTEDKVKTRVTDLVFDFCLLCTSTSERSGSIERFAFCFQFLLSQFNKLVRESIAVIQLCCTLRTKVLSTTDTI